MKGRVNKEKWWKNPKTANKRERDEKKKEQTRRRKTTEESKKKEMYTALVSMTSYLFTTHGKEWWEDD